MPELSGPRARWVRTEAAKHTTPESIRRRIAHAEREIRALEGAGISPEVERAREAHRQLIQVLSQQLASHARENRIVNFR